MKCPHLVIQELILQLLFILQSLLSLLETMVLAPILLILLVELIQLPVLSGVVSHQRLVV
jgi:hypothetical protein